MEINFAKSTIGLDKELNALDKFAISFTEVLKIGHKLTRYL